MNLDDSQKSVGNPANDDSSAADNANANTNAGVDSGIPQINAVFGKLPFPKLNSKYNIESWFIKVDAWFELHGFGIRKEKDKYTAIIAHADDYILDQVFELVRNPPTTTPYTTLKMAIIEKFSDYAMARLDRLTGIQLGDGKPSHLLSQMQRTNATKDESVIQQYWLKQLPEAARAVIAGMLQAQPSTPLHQLAITADAVLDALSRDSNATATTRGPAVNAIETLTSRFSLLEKRIEKQDSVLENINAKLHQLMSQNRSRQRDRSQGNPKRQSTPHLSSKVDQLPTCWYHREYGTQARKCRSPCDFPVKKADKPKN
ncbi:PREDICTED: uncharacterized protein LOC108369168 [Rhagoletis zephyria]|uniref:uncharacterized protein LOC108369168 n=1 Tax=Rhagoletis zephyria TaxID=28612 RepID=UPI0008117BAF|nr:PREDICTED: uncharacterized protein LOC108369168 [Rhagoletis zephyria]